MMTGIVRTIRESHAYGFIRARGMDYFFHKDDYLGDWKDLVADHTNDIEIRVEFDPKDTPKGLRAADVKRLE